MGLVSASKLGLIGGCFVLGLCIAVAVAFGDSRERQTTDRCRIEPGPVICNNIDRYTTICTPTSTTVCEAVMQRAFAEWSR